MLKLALGLSCALLLPGASVRLAGAASSTPTGACCDYSDCNVACTQPSAPTYDTIPTNSVFSCQKSYDPYDTGDKCSGDGNMPQCGTQEFWSAGCGKGNRMPIPIYAIECDISTDSICNDFFGG